MRVREAAAFFRTGRTSSVSAASGIRSARSRRDGTLGLDPVAGRPTDLVDPAEELEQRDEAGARVDLTAEHAVPRGGGVGVVQVVPGLAHRDEGEWPDVARLVAALERP